MILRAFSKIVLLKKRIDNRLHKINERGLMNIEYCISVDCPRLCEFTERIVGVDFPRGKCLVGENSNNDSHKIDVEEVVPTVCELLRQEKISE